MAKVYGTPVGIAGASNRKRPTAKASDVNQVRAALASKSTSATAPKKRVRGSSLTAKNERGSIRMVDEAIDKMSQ